MKTDFIKSARSLCRLFGGTFKALVAIAALAFTGAAWADTAVVNGLIWTYTLTSSGNAMIDDVTTTSSTKPTGALSIPSTLNSHTVVTLRSLSTCTGVTSVTIPNTVTRIAGTAFKDWTGLTSVSIPSSVTQIEYSAFEGCTSLTSVSLPNSVTSLGNTVFKNCTKLSSVTIGSGVKSIPASAFEGCSSLTYIYLPPTVTSLGSQAFRNCSKLSLARMPKALMGTFTETAVFSGNASGLEIRYYGSEKPSGSSYTFMYEIVSDGAGGSRRAALSYRSSSSTSWGLAISPNPSSTATVTIPSTLGGYSVKQIDPFAFMDAGMKSVGLPSSLTSIKGFAFLRCANLTSVTVPNSVTEIQALSFYDCTKLAAASLPKAFVGNITESSVFNNCASSLVVSYRQNGSSAYVQKSGDYYWYYRLVNGKAELYNEDETTAVTPKPTGSVTVPGTLGSATVNSIGYSALEQCSGLTSVTLPTSVTNVSAYAFYKCSALKSVSGLTNVKGFGYAAFMGCSALTTVTLPTSLASIPTYMFSGCSSLASITIPSSVKSIGSNAFQNCSKLASITIPSSVTSIGSSAFSGCSGLTSLTISGTGLTSIAASAFQNCTSLTRVYIPSSVTSIGNNAFKGCSKLDDVHLPKAFLSSGAGTDVFANCAANLDPRYYGSETVGAYTWHYELMVRGGQRVAEVVRRNVSGTSLNWNYAIYGLPDSGRYVVTIPSTLGGYNVVSIGRSAFFERAALGKATIPSTVTNISYRAFYRSGIVSVEVPDSVTILSNDAFQDCANLQLASLPAALYGKIDESKVFTGCHADLVVTYRVNSTVSKQKVGNYFWYFKTLPGNSVEITYQVDSPAIDPKPTGSVTIPSTLGGMPVASLGTSAFDGCTALTGVGTMPSTVTNIGKYAFYNCKALTSIILPSSLGAIGVSAFYNCDALTSVTIPNSVKSIGGSAFNGCDALKTINLGTGLTIINDGAFANCPAVARIYVPANVKTIESDAFKNCTSLANLHLDYATFFGKISQSDICSGCSSALNLRYYGTLARDGLTWFYELVTKNGSVVDSELVRRTATSVGQAVRTSAGTAPTGTVTVPDDFTSIGTDAFYNMSDLTEVVIPSSVSKINVAAFEKSGIERVTVPDSVTTLGDNAFRNCASLETASLPGRFLGAINESTVFSGCPDVKVTYRISGTVTAEKEGDYYWCYRPKGGTVEIYRNGSYTGDAPAISPKPTGTATISIPQTIGGKIVTSIGQGAFAGCTGVAGVEIPNTVTNIDKNAFRGSALTSVMVPGSVERIGYGAFYGCTSLADLSLANGLKYIDESAFYGCSKLTEVVFPNTVKTIGREAFWNCSKLATVTIGSGVTEIGYHAFDGTALATVYVAGGNVDAVKAMFTNSGHSITVITFIDMNAWIVTFNTNGGTGGTTRSVSKGSAVGTLPSASRTGYTFKGWFTDPAGGTQVTSSTKPASDVTYYAHWEVKQYTLTFNANGGEGGTSMTLDYNSTLVPPVVTRSGYTFQGWSPAVPAKVPAANTTYTAQWELIPVVYRTVAFDANGGVISGESSRSVEDGKAVGALPGATRSGYTFDGWFTSASGGAQVSATTTVTADVTYYAHWTLIPVPTYTVTFDRNWIGGGSPIFVTGKEGTVVSPLPSATREGYTFLGWFTAATGGTKIEADTEVDITEDTVLYAHWTEIPPAVIRTVTFDAHGGSAVVSREVEDGAEVGTLPATSREGYTFDGWFTAATGGTKISASTKVTADVTYHAQWTETAVPKYTVMFDAKGGTCGTASISVDAGEQIGAALPEATRTGYDFAGWRTGASTPVDASTVVNENMSCWAEWTPKIYKLTLDATGGTVSPTEWMVVYDSTYGAIPSANRGGYSFNGWFTATTGGTKITAGMTVAITADTTLYAQWTEVLVPTHTVTFNANGGTCATPSTTVKDGSKIGTLPEATRTGYTFAGWKTGASTPVDADTVVSADMDCWADWTPNTYTVTFDAQGGTASAASMTVTYDSAYGTMPTATRGADTFLGWFTAATGGTEVKPATIVAITANQTLYAHWAAVCTVTFDAQGGSPAPASVMVSAGDPVGTLPAVSRSGYTFKGWFTSASGGTQISASTTVAASITYYAQWTEVVVPTYTVTFDAQGGTPAPSPKSVKDGSAVGTLPTVSQTGFTFKGWFTNPTGGEQIYASTVIHGDATYYAQWTSSAAVFTIVDGVLTAVELNGVKDVVIPDGVTAIADEVFMYADITSVVIPEGVTAIGANAFTLCNSLTRVVLPGTVAVQGDYIFSNCASLQEVVFGEGITSVGKSMFYNCMALNSVTLPKSIETIGDNAFDWNDYIYPTFSGVVTVKVAYGDTARITALWENAWRCVMPHVFEELPPVSCTVKFDAQGGAPAPADATLIVGDAFGTLPAVTKADYQLKGWFTEATGGEQVTEATLVTGDATIYAQWTAIPQYTVSFDVHGGAPAPAARSVKSGAEVGELPAVTKSLALFLGWFTEATGGDEVTPKTVVTGDVTFHAQWVTSGTWTDSSGIAWTFRSDGGQMVIGNGYDSAIPTETAGAVVVPAEIYGYPVKGINTSAFDGCSKLTSISFPDSVTTIGGAPFLGCILLKSVTLPPGLTAIGNLMFFNLSALESVTIPDSVTSIGEKVFYNCIALKNVTVGKNVASIADNAFAGCTALESVTYLGSCPTASSNIYTGTSDDLVSIVPDTGWEAQLAAGTWCDRPIRTDAAPITYEVIFNANGGSVSPSSVTVDEGASVDSLPTPDLWEGHEFQGWFTLPDGGDAVTAPLFPTADMEIFAHWTTSASGSGSWTDTDTGLTWYYRPATDGIGVELYRVPDPPQAVSPKPTGFVTIPDTLGGKPVTGIGHSAFVVCDEMTGVKIPDTVTYIGDWAFAQTGLTEIELPAGLTTIGEYAFYGCYDLASVEISSGVTSIGAGAFMNDTSLAEVTIPSTVTSIGADAFNGAPVTTVHVEEGKADEVRKMLEDSGYDVSEIGEIKEDAGTGVAKWMVTFNANGGIVSPATRAVTDGEALGTLPVPTMAGSTCKGWFTQAEGGVEVTAAFVPTADIEIFAQWKVVSSDRYKLTLELNGGTYSETVLEYDAGDQVGFLPIPEGPEGRNCFKGWFWDSEFTLEVQPTDEMTGDRTCYASWSETKETMTVLVNGIRWSYYYIGNTAVGLSNNGRPLIPADYKGALIIPAKIANKNVAVIGNGAFYGCTGLTSVIIPDGVGVITHNAFAWCENLSIIQIGKGISMIEENAFQGCTSLKVMDLSKCKEPPRVVPGAFDLVPTVAAYVPKTFLPTSSTWYPYSAFSDYSYMMRLFGAPYRAIISVGYKDWSTGPVRGKFTTSGTTEIGKSYTLKATVNKGFAFAGWWDGKTGERVSRALSFAYLVTGEDRTFLADFVSEYEDYINLAIAQGDVTTDDDGAVEIDLGAATTSYSEPKLTVKGLPTGLKYDAKTLKVAGVATKPGRYSVTVTATNASRKSAKEAVSVTFTLTVPNFKDKEIPVEDSYGPFIPGVPLDPVTLVPAAEGCKVTGLPTGMKWTEKNIVDNKTKLVTVPAYSFYGTPTKPGNYTVYFTKTTKDVYNGVTVKHTATATFVVDRLRTLTLLKSGATGKDNVKGAGNYEANKKVSLKATADKGKVFSGWYDNSTGDLVDRAANYSYVMPAVDTTLTGLFIDESEDRKHLDTIVGGFASFDQNKIGVDPNAVWNQKTIEQGVYVEWPIDAKTWSFATIKVSGLPAGLKFTAKDVVDSKTKAVIVPANTIYGTPTAASKLKKGYVDQYDPSIVKITVTTAGKVTANYQLDVYVTALRPWAVGTFDGGGDYGQVTLTVANTGKISGKFLADGKTLTLAADGYSAFDATPGNEVYEALLTGKVGTDTLQLRFYIEPQTIGKIGGTDEVVGAGALADDGYIPVAMLSQTKWKAEPWKTIAKAFAKAPELTYFPDGTSSKSIILKFASSGTVTVKGTILGYQASGSATLVPYEIKADGSFDALVYVYFPPKTGKFAGYVEAKMIRWDAATGRFLIPAP